MPQETPIACTLGDDEGKCCAFFEFATTRAGEETEVEIRTPEGGEPLLRGLVAGIVAGWEGGLA